MKSRQIVFEIHRLKDEGYSVRAIAETLGIGRNTVIRYLKDPDRTMAPRIKTASKPDPYKEQITFLRDYLRKQRGRQKTRQAYIRFESKPGRQMQIDWGHFGTISYGDINRKLYALVVIESFSRMLYVEFTHSQNQQALHGCLLNAFKAFGGTPQTIVVDNMLTAVTERQSRVIRFNDAFLDFLRPFQITPRACNPGAPHEKGKVEAAVKYVRRNFMPLREFKDLEGVNTQVLFWLEKVANVRIHHTTGEPPRQRFAKVKLKELPELMPEPYESHTLVVHKDFAVRFDGNTHPVPPWAIGKKLTLKADQQRIWIYHKNKQVISYPRCWQRKQRIETEAHVEQVKKLQRKNWQTKEIACFASLGEEFRQYLELLPNSKLPLKKQVLMLLDLKDQYGVQSLSVAIMKAMKHKAYGADYIENILYQEMIPQNRHPPVKLKNEALNRIRLTEPTLSAYDAIALKKRKKHD